MAKKLTTRDLLHILEDYLDEDDFDKLSNWTDLEQQFLLGAAFSQIGDALTQSARAEALKIYGGTRGPQMMGRLSITYSPGHTQTVLDTKLVKEFYPPETHEGFYKTRNIKETVRVSIGDAQPKPNPVAGTTQLGR